MTTKSGFQVELALGEDGEVLMMGGKAVAAVKDEEGNTMLMAADGGVVMTDFDGKSVAPPTAQLCSTCFCMLPR
jgi:hypothetical protein